MDDRIQPDYPDPLADTQPGRASPPLHQYQPIPIQNSVAKRGVGWGKRKKRLPGWLLLVVLLLGVYFFFPMRTNILFLGSDDSPSRGELGRTDAIILTTFNPGSGYVGMLAIPRDLWVVVPDIGEQRINTAYFFAEVEQKGAGGAAAVETVRQNFGVKLDYYVVIHMVGVVNVVDALGGLDIHLDKAMGGLPAGEHLLQGEQALAFIRERYSADDFSRMRQGQLLIRAALSSLLDVRTWLRLPLVGAAILGTIDTNIPVVLWPRLAFAFLRSGSKGVDARIITREMVTPFKTYNGAQVLAPNWQAINPVLLEMFGE